MADIQARLEAMRQWLDTVHLARVAESPAVPPGCQRCRVAPRLPRAHLSRQAAIAARYAAAPTHRA